jgi:hypothetical protein
MNWILLIAPFIIAATIAWGHPGWKGVLIATLTLWGFVAMAMVFVLAREGTGGPGGILFLLWVLTGWLWSAAFSSLAAWASNQCRRDN